MRLPIWIARLLRWLGYEAIPALQCTSCGRLISLSQDSTDEQWDAAVKRHDHFFHPERIMMPPPPAA